MDVIAAQSGGSASSALTSLHTHAANATDGAARSSTLPAQVEGAIDGPDLVLPSGVRIRRMRIGPLRVSQLHILQAIQGIQLLPLGHQQLIARMGIPIKLVPIKQLEQVPGTSEPVVGATLIDGPVGDGRPVGIRLAARMAELSTPASIIEAVQHEIGHAIAVVASQDRSEQAAEAYAARY